MRRTWFSSLAGPLIIACVAVFLVQSCVRSQKTADRVKDQLVAIVNARLIPQLEILHVHRNSATSFDLEGISLTHPDGTTIISVHRAEITLAALPLPGHPIQFAKIDLFRPRIELIETAEGLLGLSPILKDSTQNQTEGSGTESESDDRSLSDIITLRNVVIRNGTVRYTSLSQPDDPMVLNEIVISTSLQPSVDGEPGWQDLTLDLGRQPGVSVDLDGRLNLDTWDLQIARFDLNAAIDRETADSLPPTLQRIVRNAQLNGDVIVEAIGEVPLLSPSLSELRVTLQLAAAHAVVGGAQVPIEEARGTFLLENGTIRSRNLLVEAAGGRLWGTLTLDPSLPGTPLNADVRAENIEIGYFTANDRITGKAAITGAFSYDTQPQSLEPKLGDMTVTLTDASILSLPVFRQIASTLDVVPRVNASNNHRAEATFDINRDRLSIENLRFVTAAIAGDIQGDLLFDGTVDLEAKAGPLARVRELMGPLGMPFEKLVDASSPYRITGPIGNPVVRILGKTVSGKDDG